MAAGTMNEVLSLLDAHHEAFFAAKSFADKTFHPVPCDTRAWSQILVSLLTGINGRERKKGTDLIDGSDVKAANCWSAIDTPYIFFVLWDDDTEGHPRCRIWCVRPGRDKVFRAMCKKWYDGKVAGTIKSDNFQLHPPRYRDENVFRNECGNLSYPLLFCAIRKDKRPFRKSLTLSSLSGVLGDSLSGYVGRRQLPWTYRTTPLSCSERHP